MKEFVVLQDITKIYKMGEIEIRAADNISFSIDKGEFVVIVGPSGAGKTTVLNILGGMDTATLKKNIEICRSLTDKPFGVNIMLINHSGIFYTGKSVW